MDNPTTFDKVTTGISKFTGGTDGDTGTIQVAVTMGAALLFGCVAICLCLDTMKTVSRGLMWAAAWSSVGWFLGFLFGIPRYLSTDTARMPEAPALATAKSDLAKLSEDARSAHEKATQAVTARDAASASATQLTAAHQQALQALADADAALQAHPTDPALQKAQSDAKAASDDAKLKADAASSAATDAENAAQAAAGAAKSADDAVQAAGQKVKTVEASVKSVTGSSLTVNTNLEQISDWLTKIIVGVSLVEAQTLLLKMQSTATFMAKSMTPFAELRAIAAWRAECSASDPCATAAVEAASAAASAALTHAQSLQVFSSTESFAYAVMLYFLATGLLGSYLLTRLFLQRALNAAANSSTA